jgi:hypothetical protein
MVEEQKEAPSPDLIVSPLPLLGRLLRSRRRIAVDTVVVAGQKGCSEFDFPFVASQALCVKLGPLIRPVHAPTKASDPYFSFLTDLTVEPKAQYAKDTMSFRTPTPWPCMELH